MERSYTRNNGAQNARGQVIMFLDDDDEFLPSKIETQLSRIKEKPDEYAVCYCDFLREYGGKIICRSSEKREGDLLFDALGRNLFIHPGSNY
jgi:glycosyltransferase involved in cell wall biosynthesis